LISDIKLLEMKIMKMLIMTPPPTCFFLIIKTKLLDAQQAKKLIRLGELTFIITELMSSN